MARRSLGNGSSGEEKQFGSGAQQKSPQAAAGAHSAERRKVYLEKMKPVPDMVRKLPKRISELRKDWKMHGSASQLFAEQEKMVRERDALEETLGNGLPGAEKEVADQKRRKGYNLVGNLILDPKIREILGNEYKSGNQQEAPLVAFENAATNVADAVSKRNKYLERLSTAQTILTAVLRPQLKDLEVLSQKMADTVDLMKKTPVSEGSADSLDIERYSQDKKLVEAAQKRENEGLPSTSQMQAVLVNDQAYKSLERQFAEEMLPCVEEDVIFLQREFNDKVRGEKGLSTRTNFFHPETSPFEDIDRLLREHHVDDVIDTVQHRLMNAMETKDILEKRVLKSSTDQSRVLASFEREFPEVFLKAWALRPTGPKVELIKHIDDALSGAIDTLSGAIDTLERQLTYARLRKNKHNASNDQLLPVRVHFQNAYGKQEEILQKYEQRAAEIVRGLQNLSEQSIKSQGDLEKAKAFKAAFETAVRPGGVGHALWQQYAALENEARGKVAAIVSGLAEKQNMNEQKADAVNSPLCQEFLALGLRNLLLEQVQNPKTNILLGKHQTRTPEYFSELIDETMRKLTSTITQDDLERRITEAKEARDQAEIELLDKVLEIKLEYLNDSIREIGEKIKAMDTAAQKEKAALYTDVRDIVARVKDFCEVTKRQLEDVQDSATSAAAKVMEAIQRIRTSSEAVGLPLQLSLNDLGGENAQSMALLAMGQGEASIIPEEVLEDMSVPPAANALTLVKETDMLRTALAPLSGMGNLDKAAERRITGAAENLVHAIQAGVRNTHDTLHADAERIDKDITHILTEFVVTTSQLCQSIEGFKKGLDNANQKLQRSESELNASSAALTQAEIDRTGDTFNDEVARLMKGDHVDNPLVKVRKVLEAFKVRSRRLQQEIENYQKAEGTGQKDVDLDPELTRKISVKTQIDTEVIPDLERKVKTDEERARNWAEEMAAPQFDEAIKRAKVQSEQKNREWQRARAEVHAMEEQFIAGVSAFCMLMDAQRALNTSADISNVFASQSMSSFQDLVVFVAKLKELGPRKTAFSSPYDEEIHILEDALKRYEDFVKPFLNNKTEVREKVGSDFEVREWKAMTPDRLLGMTRQKVGEAVGNEFGEEMKKLTGPSQATDLEHLVPSDDESSEDEGSEASATDDLLGGL